MLANQKTVIDNNIVKLVEAAEWATPLVLNHLQISGVISNGEREIVESKLTSAAKLNQLFGILKTKDAGWSQLQSYLRSHNQSCLADKLQDEANGAVGENELQSPKRSALKEFSLRLAHYYKDYYSNVPTMGQSGKHVKDVWVPLQIDGRKEDFLAVDHINHTELLHRLKSTQHCNVGLIKGDPGMGKTTLAKKIAYDWAVDYSSNKAPQFSLVLAIPLRSAGNSTHFDQLAIDYFCSIGRGQLVKDIINKELIEEITKLESQLLVILDGLDEYANYSESPFKDMFAGPFQHSSPYSKDPPPIVSFKLIITSRPYACEDVQMDFPLLKYVISPLDTDHLDNFVHLYCETSHGAVRVTDYLKFNAKLVINVPLILTFICYLADSVQEIPTNMTSLYDSFIRQMLRREKRQEKLAESVDIQSWKDSKLVKTTSRLAYRGLTDVNYQLNEFSQLNLDKCQVTNDSYICGFLLHKYNFAQESLTAEFPHRSIQEFFAALHCYKLMLDDNKDDIEQVNKLITNRRGSLVGRFFFGICSKEERFDQIKKWLRPSLRDYNVFQPAMVINTFGSALADCSSQQNFHIGQKLSESAGYLYDYIIDFGFDNFNQVEYYRLAHDQFTDDFRKGLQLRVLPGGLTADWFLADNRKSARFVCVRNRLQQLIDEKFDQIDFFILCYGTIGPSAPSNSAKHQANSGNHPLSDSQSFSVTLLKTRESLSLIQQLPPVRTFVITTQVDFPFTSTIFSVRYGREMGLELTNFQFLYKNNDREELLGIVAREKLADLTVDETTEDKSDHRMSKRKLQVTVNQDMSQLTLIASLMRLSLLG